MANDSGGQSFLGFILGGVVVVVLILGFIVYSGGHLGTGAGPTKTVNITVPSSPTTR